jgi:hypothetical protein
MPAPSLLNDGPNFFLNVLIADDFKRQGRMARTEGRISWAVVDPRRHKLFIWQKDRDDFLAAANARTSTVVTNAPFAVYQEGRYGAHVRYWLEWLWETFKLVMIPRMLPPELLRRLRAMNHDLVKQYFGNSIVEGKIFGQRDGIVEDSQSRPATSYFGRRQGRLFADYIIDSGDPQQSITPEVIGGFFRNVLNYAPNDDNGEAAEVGTWGLAPILSAPAPQLRLLRDAGLDAVLEEYEEFLNHPQDGVIPKGEGVLPTDKCDGLLIAIFGGGSPPEFDDYNAQVLVKEAVRVDGNNSILLQVNGAVLQGSDMPEYKQVYNFYGYEFIAG